MSVLLNLSTLALHELIEGTGNHCRGLSVADATLTVTGVLLNHFRDQSDRLNRALRDSNKRAWQTLEVALAGDSFWDRCKGLLVSGEDKRFRREMTAHLQRLTLPTGDSDRFRKLCLAELRAARNDVLLAGDQLDPEALATGAGAFARFSDPLEIVQAQAEVMRRISDLIRRARYENLARLLDLQPRPDSSLLTVAVRYFFRRAIEDDPKLFQGLAFAQLERLQQGQREQFAAIQELLTSQGDKLESMMGELQADLSMALVAVLDVQEEQRRIGGQNDDIYQAVLQLQGKLDMMQSKLRPRDSLSIRGDTERLLVRELVARYRALPEDQRKDMPALLNAVGKLQVAAGDFQAAERDFAAVATLVDDSGAKAEAFFNAYRAALERRDWESALRELIEAIKLDPKRYEAFPLRKYRPERILGAGGFGVAFLCWHNLVRRHVVVKTLTADDLQRSLEDVFAEGAALRGLDHPAIIRLGDCDFADAGQKRPYLEMDYFESLSLEDHVRQHGHLTEEDLNEVARQMAEGLRAAHQRGVLHRDVKPGNLLVRRLDGRWQVKLIDFGLALGLDRLTGSATSATLRGSSIAGTIDYAAPEQMGKLPGVAVVEASDVYGFGRTCCFALFGTPYPKAKHFDRLSPKWRSLIDDCISEPPHERPANFDEVLRRLGDPSEMMTAMSVAPPPPAASPSAPGATGGSGWGSLSSLANSVLSAFAPNAPGASTPTRPPAPAPTPAATAPPTPPAPPPPPASPPRPPVKPPEVLEVIPMAPTSEGIEIVEDTLDVIPVNPPVKKPKPPSSGGNKRR